MELNGTYTLVHLGMLRGSSATKQCARRVRARGRLRVDLITAAAAFAGAGISPPHRTTHYFYLVRFSLSSHLLLCMFDGDTFYYLACNNEGR